MNTQEDAIRLALAQRCARLEDDNERLTARLDLLVDLMARFRWVLTELPDGDWSPRATFSPILNPAEALFLASLPKPEDVGPVGGGF